MQRPFEGRATGRWNRGSGARRMSPLFIALLLAAAPGYGLPTAGGPIPAFSRKYRTSCSTCHTAAPKLNVMGEAFRLNGYRFPENDAFLRKEDPVPLGADPWKELWPAAIWPGEIPGTAPLALAILNDALLSREAGSHTDLRYSFPHEVHLLASGTLGETISAFLESEWSPDEGIVVEQAKVEFQDLLSSLLARALNVWVGLQNLYLFTFADPAVDRAARETFRWQRFRVSDIELTNATTGDTLRSTNESQLRDSRPTIELNGIVARNLYYAAGFAQGLESGAANDGARGDLYYKLRYKLGGLALDGSQSTDVVAERGQLHDRSITIEHFGYFGAEPTETRSDDTHRAFGANLRVIAGPADFGIGYVETRHERPWGNGGPVRSRSAFGKAEYQLLPWFIASLKAERFEVNIEPSALPAGFTAAAANETSVMPAVIILIRQNVRLVTEGRLFVDHSLSAERGTSKPFRIASRLAVAF